MDTVKITMSFDLAGMPFTLTEVADTGYSREEWDAMPFYKRNQIAQGCIADWTETIVDTDWLEMEEQ